MQKIFIINFLRFLSIFLITAFHVSRWMGYKEIGFFSTFRNIFRDGGNIGCYLFFCISGYCLAFTYKEGTPYFKYLFKRLLKIIPAYYIAILFWYIFSSQDIVPANHRIKDILYHLLFIHGFSNKSFYAISGVFWFLSILVQFYLLFPLLFNICQKYKKTAISISIFSFFIVQLISIFFDCDSPVLLKSIFTNLPCFMFGVLCYFYPPEIKNIWNKRIILFLTILSLFIRLGNVQFFVLLKSLLLFLSIFSFQKEIQNIPVYCHKAIDFIAKISFSVYLYNYSFYLIKWDVKNAITFSASMLIVFLFGTIMWFIIECPFQKIIKKPVKK